MNEIRNTKFYPPKRDEPRFGFTLVELVVAIGIMALVILFAGTVFKSSINSYRIASAQAEIMQKFRAITQQLDSDFQGLQKDGYLILYSENLLNRTEYPGAPLGSFRSDRLYFFSTGDFQSWYDPTVRSNIARIYLGHERHSIFDSTIYVNRWRLAHDTLLLSTAASWPDVNDVNYAWCQVHPTEITNNANAMFSNLPDTPDINIADDPNTIRRLFCENAGQFKIEWADGSIDPNSAIAWFGLGNQKGIIIESGVAGSNYNAEWQPSISADLWPKALKFTFTLYDSRGVFKDGQTFTHIVYLGD
jgi:prepilin-type N-terminal cleavage/methylation domain-containing protein